MKLAYCDYIADVISRELDHTTADPDGLLKRVGPAKMDLHPTEGWFISTKKTVEVEDRNGKTYKVTVEEV